MFQPRAGQWSGDCSRQILQLTDITIQPQVVNPTTAERVVCGSLTGISSNNEIPSEFTLEQNYPNPFNPSTRIGFSLPEDGIVSLTIYDITGKEVKRIIEGFKMKGKYSVDFDAGQLSGGVYFYELSAGSFTQTKKMVLVK
jgi:hypothetical protein